MDSIARYSSSSTTANCIIIAPKRLKLRLSGSARKLQQRFRDTPRFNFQAVFARTQPFQRSNERSETGRPPSLNLTGCCTNIRRSRYDLNSGALKHQVTPSAGETNTLFRYQKTVICQDRLGTNRRKKTLNKKRVFFSSFFCLLEGPVTQIVSVDEVTRTLFYMANARRYGLKFIPFLRFPYVCPELVLAK